MAQNMVHLSKCSLGTFIRLPLGVSEGCHAVQLVDGGGGASCVLADLCLLSHSLRGAGGPPGVTDVPLTLCSLLVFTCAYGAVIGNGNA